jgi:hypothetical protein
MGDGTNNNWTGRADSRARTPVSNPAHCKNCQRYLGDHTELGDPRSKPYDGTVGRYDVAWCDVCKVWLCTGCAIAHHTGTGACVAKALGDESPPVQDDRED